jgi:aromatic ring-opening dioxygenase catalytic subunit (LigB family)
MGEVVGAAVLSHVPTIVLPDDVRRALNNGEESTLYTGLHDVRREVFDVLQPDLVVVFDSHWFTTVEFVVAAQQRRSGRYTSEELPRGMCQVPYDVPGDPEFAEALQKEGEATEDCWITAIDDECLPIHYPTINLLGFLQGPERWVSVSTAQTGSPDDFLTVGGCVARAIERLDRRVFLVASGALSHTFWGLRQLRAHEAAGEEHIFTKEAAAADHRVLDAWERGDHRAVLDGMPEYLTFKPEGRFGHYLMTAGALGGRACTARGRRYSAYENSIGTGQAHVVFERPDGGWTA